MDVTIACACPPKDGQVRHPDGDTVTLHEPIEARVRRALLYDMSLMDEEASTGDKLALLSEGYLLRCIDRWSILDEKAKPLAPSHENIRRLLIDDPYRGDIVAKAADDLYSEAVLLPLMVGASSSSPGSPTNGSTSRTTNGPTPRQRRSKPSSTITTQMAGIAPTLLSNGGGYSSSAS